MNFTDKLSDIDPLQGFSLQFAPKELQDFLALFYVSYYEWHNIVKNASFVRITSVITNSHISVFLFNESRASSQELPFGKLFIF